MNRSRTRSFRFSIIGVLVGIVVFAVGTSSAFAVIANPYPLQYSNFQGADGDQDDPADDLGGAYPAGRSTGNADVADNHDEIDWENLAVAGNACPTPPP